jgi:hypothetical protein
MNTSTKQTENLAKCSDKSKPLLVAVTCQLTERGFQLKTEIKLMMMVRYKIIFTNEVGKYVEI